MMKNSVLQLLLISFLILPRGLPASAASIDKQKSLCREAGKKIKRLEEGKGFVWNAASYTVSFFVTAAIAKYIIKPKPGYTTVTEGLVGFGVEKVIDLVNDKLFESKISNAEKMCLERAKSDSDFDPILFMLAQATNDEDNASNSTTPIAPPSLGKPSNFTKFDLERPKPTDCHNATFKLRDTSSGKLYVVILRDAEQINACSINFTAQDAEIAEQVARFVGLSGDANFAYLSAVGDCDQRIVRIVNKKKSTNPIDVPVKDNCKILNFTKGPTQLALFIAQYFNL